jgi:hypothetical protein
VSYTGLYRLVWWIIIAIEAANCGRFIHKKEANRIANPIVGFENPHMFRGRYLTWSGFFYVPASWFSNRSLFNEFGRTFHSINENWLSTSI